MLKTKKTVEGKQKKMVALKQKLICGDRKKSVEPRNNLRKQKNYVQKQKLIVRNRNQCSETENDMWIEKTMCCNQRRSERLFSSPALPEIYVCDRKNICPIFAIIFPIWI